MLKDIRIYVELAYYQTIKKGTALFFQCLSLFSICRFLHQMFEHHFNIILKCFIHIFQFCYFRTTRVVVQ